MKKFFISFYTISLITTSLVLLPVDPVKAEAVEVPTACIGKVGVLVFPFKCNKNSAGEPGKGEIVIIKAGVGSATEHNNDFEGYINTVLEKYFPFILFIAMIMIVYSGVQYMLSGFDPNAQKLAKQRILGILGGLIFYLLIQLILNQLVPDTFIGGINTTP